ncbi:MAG: D-alanine--D-alanine ligase [Christensenellales bacterium]
MKILVLAGGLSPEREVSLSTGTMVCNALREKGQDAMLVDLFYGVEELPGDIESFFADKTPLPPYVIESAVPDLSRLREESRNRPYGTIGKNVIELCKAADIVFMALHGEPGENGMVQAMLDMLDIKYTGAGYRGSAIAMDKALTKHILVSRGINTAEGIMLKRGEPLPDVPLPCIVKPCSGGSSIGVRKVFNKADVLPAVEEAFKYEDDILIESFVNGREITCGVLGDTALPPAEVIPKGGFYDYAHKYQSGHNRVPCGASGRGIEEVQDISLRVFRALGLEVYARMDFIYDGRDFYCLEANTLPGMTPTSHLPQEAKAMGISYPELCMRIIELSLEKYNK